MCICSGGRNCSEHWRHAFAMERRSSLQQSSQVDIILRYPSISHYTNRRCLSLLYPHLSLKNKQTNKTNKTKQSPHAHCRGMHAPHASLQVLEQHHNTSIPVTLTCSYGGRRQLSLWSNLCLPTHPLLPLPSFPSSRIHRSVAFFMQGGDCCILTSPLPVFIIPNPRHQTQNRIPRNNPHTYTTHM